MLIKIYQLLQLAEQIRRKQQNCDNKNLIGSQKSIFISKENNDTDQKSNISEDSWYYKERKIKKKSANTVCMKKENNIYIFK